MCAVDGGERTGDTVGDTRAHLPTPDRRTNRHTPLEKSTIHTVRTNHTHKHVAGHKLHALGPAVAALVGGGKPNAFRTTKACSGVTVRPHTVTRKLLR